MASIKKRGTNIWQITIYLGKDENGKKINRWETIHGTKTQAKARGAELEAEIKRKTNSKGILMTVGQMLDFWLIEIEKTVYERTFQKYKWHVSKLKPIVGDIELIEIRPLDIKQRLDGIEGLSPRTIKDLYCTLRTAFNLASAWDLVRENVMKGIKPPTIEHKERDILTEEQLKYFIESAKEYKHYLVLRILALTGMRIGEVLGLKWGDVNWESGEITILRSANTRSRVLKDTKTKQSPRTILLDEETIKLLKQQKKDSLKSKIGLNDLVFQNEEGKPLRYNAIRRTKEKILKKTGLQHIRLHDLRHGVGSIMIDNGSSITEVAELLGQKPSTTAGIYSHAMRKGKSLAFTLDKNNSDDSGGNSGKSLEMY
jgi:integrase